MPIKSKAQRRKFAELLVEGKITPETFEEWNRGAGSADLPERLHPKPTSTARKRSVRKAAKKTARTTARKTTRKITKKTAKKTARKTARKARKKAATR